MNKDRIAAIWADEDFQAVVSQIEEKLTRKVMSQSTAQEDRDQTLAQYHGLQTLKGTLRAISNETVKEKTHD